MFSKLVGGGGGEEGDNKKVPKNWIGKWSYLTENMCRQLLIDYKYFFFSIAKSR